MLYATIKKYIAALLLLVLTGSCACAQVQSKFNAHLFSDMLTVEITGLEPGQEYSFLVFPADEEVESPALENLLLIDQLTATESGTLMVGIQNAVPCFIMLGGQFDGQDSPLLLGSYTGNEEPQNVLKTPAMLTEIREEAFMNSAFNYVYISDLTTTIGPRAFMNCTELCGVFIPAGVTTIGEDAFAGCDQLVIVCTENSTAHLYAIENGIDYSLDH